jgi:hypothetical protein
MGRGGAEKDDGKKADRPLPIHSLKVLVSVYITIYN